MSAFPRQQRGCDLFNTGGLALTDERPLIAQGLFQEVPSLPVLLWLWQRMLGHLENSWSYLADLEGIIRQDQSLNSCIIGAANSS